MKKEILTTSLGKENQSDLKLLLTEDEQYICDNLNFLDLKDIGDDYCLFVNKDKIKRFYEKCFTQDWLDNNPDFANATSQATAYFKKIVDRYSSFLFSKFPEIEAPAEIKEFLNKNSNEISKILEEASLNYILYGCSILQVSSNNSLENIEDYEGWYLYKDILIKTGDLTADEKSYEALKKLFPNNDFDIKNAVVVYYNNNKYLYNGGRISKLKASEISNNSVIIDTKPLVNYVYSLFCELESLYIKRLKTTEILKTIALYPSRHKDIIKEIFKENFVGIDIQGSEYSVSAGNMFNFVSNAPVAETINIINASITQTKQDIVSHLDKEDLFNGLADDNPNETRVAATNRVALSQINIEANQRKFNDFLECALKFYVSKNLGIPYNQIQLEANSVSILKIEQDKAQEEAEYQKILALLQQASAVPPIMANIYFTLALEEIEGSNYLTLNKKKQLKTIVESAATQQQQMLNQQMLQAQQPQPEQQLAVEKAQADIRKTQEETKKLALEAAKIESDIQIQEKLKEEELALKREQEARKTIDETQQLIDAQTRASKQQSNNSLLQKIKSKLRGSKNE